ncbi:PqqD family protein [Paracoccus ravus]|uniref:PqqD family protein n=1 Tax=Paracoccus ravus TaxID=2447760 RepID=UPI00106E33E7|nr:PqqD family protein [Paracoccus ravus]
MLYEISPDCVACEVEDGFVILNLESNLYFGLDGIGAEIWKNLEEPRSIDDLIEFTLSNYEVCAADCSNDVLALVAEMRQNGLVRQV